MLSASFIDSINSVEDTKGNNGERGKLFVTNLRLIWESHKNPKTNLSIGFNTAVSINIKTALDKQPAPLVIYLWGGHFSPMLSHAQHKAAVFAPRALFALK